jgi:hypothetical protein
MTPTPPSLATADASPEREIPTPIPPCIIGTVTVRLPILKPFIPFYINFSKPDKGRLIIQFLPEKEIFNIY